MSRFFIPILTVFFGLSFFAQPAQAAPRSVDGYLIDFVHTPEEITVGKKITLAFTLVDEETQEVVNPESVALRIVLGDQTFFAGNFRPESNNVTFTHVFPLAGEYRLEAQFRVDEDTSLAADFDVSVGEGQLSALTDNGVGEQSKKGSVWLPLVVLLLLTAFCIKMRGRNEHHIASSNRVVRR